MRTERTRQTPAAAFLAACAMFVVGCFTAAAGNDYRLGAGDLLHITVFGSPDLSTDVRVTDSGNITCALIGTVPVAQLSTDEVESLLARRYVEGSFLRQPQISVLVAEYQSQKIAVLGYVAKPGQYPLRSTSGTVLDILAEAGGVLPQTAGDRATLTRVDGTHVELNLEALFQGDPQQNVVLGGGDRIYVPRAEQFYIYGQVQKPGVYRLERNMTVSRAISAGGGLTPRGSERRAVVKRLAADGKEKKFSVQASDALQPDDVLFIKESLF
jgi:polysaccharide export outer membrane protein